MTHARDGNRVRLRREQRGMLLKELATAIGRKASLVSMIEGGFVPKLPTMRAIAAALDTTADQLWPDEFEPVEDES